MQVFRRFKTDQSGTTAVIFGLSLIPLMGTVGAAVDYSRAASFHSQALLAVDAAALALVREPSSLNPGQVQEKGEIFVRNALEHTNSNGRRGNTVASVTATRTGNTVKVSMAGTTRPAILQAIGYKPIPVSADSQATWGPISGEGAGKIELALVLDNTGSMDDRIGGRRKMDELHSAAKALLKDLRDLAVERETVKVSIVPFDTEVRLNPNQHRNQTWLDAKDRKNWTGYVYDRHGAFATGDAAPDPRVPNSLYPAPRDTEYRTEGVLVDYLRANPHHGKDLAPLRELTSLYDYNDYRALDAVIEGMKPRGFTNIALGVTWGMATLSKSEPFTEAAASGDKDVKKYMVVLTDGKNTMSHIDGRLQSSKSPIDAATSTACSNVKRSDVEVFTIRLLEGDIDLLRRCASTPDKYFDVQNAGELTKAFQTILRSISGTRLTH